MAEDALNIQGFKRCKGEVVMNEVNVYGLFRFKGTLQAHILRCKGVLSMKGHLQVDEVLNDGRMLINGSIATIHLISARYLKCQQLVASYADLMGQVRIDVLSCDKLLLDFQKHSRIKTIQAQTVQVKNIHTPHRLYCHSMKANRIQIDHVKADWVVGEDVNIGPHSHINHVRYTESLTIDPLARVERIEKVNG